MKKLKWFFIIGGTSTIVVGTSLGIALPLVLANSNNKNIENAIDESINDIDKVVVKNEEEQTPPLEEENEPPKIDDSPSNPPINSGSSSPQPYHYFKFDNKYFNTKNEAINYALMNSVKSNYTYQQDSYLFEGKYFENSIELDNYINKKFEINEINTILNPENYLIKGDDELSGLVANYQNDKLVRIYEGQNKIAYKNYDKALKTYMNYQKVYDIEGKYQYNELDARRVYEDILEQNLNENLNLKKKVYKQGALIQTEEQIKNWLYQNQNMGYQYDGNIYSDYNINEFREKLSNLDEHIYEKHIKEELNPDIKTFWLTNYKTYGAHYVGPKYIETTRDLDKGVNLRVIDSYTPNSPMMSVFSLMLGGLTIAQIGYDKNSSNKFDWTPTINKDGKSSKIEAFIKHLYSTDVISKARYDEFFNEDNNGFSLIRKAKLDNVLINSTKNLEKVNQQFNPEFDDIPKMFVAFKNILTSLKIAALFRDRDIETIDKLFKKTVLEVLKTNNDVYGPLLESFYKNIFIGLEEQLKEEGLEWPDSDKTKTPSKITMEEFFDFEDLFDLVMNPKRFVQQRNWLFDIGLGLMRRHDEKMDEQMKMLDQVKNIMGGIDDLKKDALKIEADNANIDSFSTLQNLNDSINEINNEKLHENIKTYQNNINEVLIKNQDAQLAKWGIKQKDSTQVGPQLAVTAIMGIVSAAYSIRKMLSFVDWKTFEIQFDESQSGYFQMPVFKIPLISKWISKALFKQEPEFEIIKIRPSIVDQLPLDNNGQKVKKLWKFRSALYSSRDTAKKEMINHMMLHPEQYINTKKIISSIMENDEGYILPIDFEKIEVIEDKQKDSNNKNEMSQTDYDSLIEKYRKEYADKLFEKYYEANAEEYYLDGFGNAFRSNLEALESMKNKLINSNNFITKYEYVNQNNKVIHRDTKQEIEDYIKSHISINSKLVLQSDLIKTANFEFLKTYQENENYLIYELNYYGDLKYFSSKLSAKNFLIRNLKFTKLSYDKILAIYKWNEEILYGNEEFKNWVYDNLKFVGSDKKINENNELEEN